MTLKNKVVAQISAKPSFCKQIEISLFHMLGSRFTAYFHTIHFMLITAGSGLNQKNSIW